MCDYVVFILLVIAQFFKILFCKHVRFTYVINAYFLASLLTYLDGSTIKVQVMWKKSFEMAFESNTDVRQ